MDLKKHLSEREEIDYETLKKKVEELTPIVEKFEEKVMNISTLLNDIEKRLNKALGNNSEK